MTLEDEIAEAMFNQDHDKLQELAGCRCCCDEHTDSCCPARIVGNCRGQGTPSRADIQAWMEHYGMDSEQFYPSNNDDEWRKYAESVGNPFAVMGIDKKYI
jgi:hypothetical protein